jgi:chromosome segregation ATPase
MSKVSCEECDKKLEFCNTQVKSYKADYEAHIQAIDSLTNENNQLQEEIKRISMKPIEQVITKNNCDEFKDTIEKLTDTLMVSKEVVEEFQQSNVKLDIENAKLHNDILKLGKRYDEEQKVKAKQYGQQIQELKLIVKEQQQKLMTNFQDNDVKEMLENQIATAENDNRALMKENEKLTEIIGNFESSLESKKSELEQQEAATRVILAANAANKNPLRKFLGFGGRRRAPTRKRSSRRLGGRVHRTRKYRRR